MSETLEELRFNAWSTSRILKGSKRLTSRRKKYVNDEIVEHITGPLPWWFIREYLYRDEGAESPYELQCVINKIFRRQVYADELFFVHVLDIPRVKRRLLNNE